MDPREISLLNLIRTLDDDVETGLYDRPRVVHLLSRMSGPDVASAAAHTQQALIREAANAELARRGLDEDGHPEPPPAAADSPEELEDETDLGEMLL